MKINSFILRWVLITAAIAMPLIYTGYDYWLRNHFTCDANIIIVDENTVLEVNSTYTFKNGHGDYQSFGQYTKKGHPPLPLSNKVTFDYWREGGRIIMVSNETNELPKRDDPLLSQMPDFYHLRDRGISIELARANASSAYFLYGQAPVFYCSRPNRR
jgi:hypothetical protein